MTTAAQRIGAVMAAALLAAATACADDPPAPATPSAASPSPTAPPASAPAQSPEAPPGETSAMNIRLSIDGQEVQAVLNDSATARDFAALLPLDLRLSDFHEQEKTADLPRPLTTDGAPEGADPRAGDLALYAPWGNLALYYRDAPYAAGLILLGRMTDPADAAKLADADHITITATTP